MVTGSFLDRIKSSIRSHIEKWSKQFKLESNKACRILDYLLMRLYESGRGHLMNAQLTLAQKTIARKLGIDKRWVNVLVQRLRAAGWLDYTSPTLLDGTNGSCIWRIGPQMKRLIIMLRESKQRKPIKSVWLNRATFSPRGLEEEKRKHILALEKWENTVSETTKRTPELQKWIKRGRKNHAGYFS